MFSPALVSITLALACVRSCGVTFHGTAFFIFLSFADVSAAFTC